MVVLISNNPLFDGRSLRMTGLPIDELRASHDTHQNQTRMGLHEEIPCLQQETGVTTVQTNVDTNGVPPYLKRKLLMRHDGMQSLNGIRKEVDRQKAADRTSTISDDGDSIHSDYSDDENGDEAHLQLRAGVGPNRNGELPPRLRWLRRRHLHLLMKRKMAVMKRAHWWHDGHDGKITAVLPARSQIHHDSPRSGKKRKDTETAIVTSESCVHNGNFNDELDDESTVTGKCRRLGSCHRDCSTPGIIPSQHVEEGLGLSANTDAACEVAAPPIPITGHLSAIAMSEGPRRSQRIREKRPPAVSACVTTTRRS